MADTGAVSIFETAPFYCQLLRMFRIPESG
jgi:hypothetical protein